MINKIDNTHLIEHVFEYDVILVPMGINNAMNNGFAREVRANFQDVYKKESEKSPYGNRRKYGTTLGIESEGLIFCMCYIYSMSDKGLTVDYNNLKKCLIEVSIKYKGKKIATPLLGASKFDGNGSADVIEGIFNEIFTDTDITLYTIDQRDVRLEKYHKLSELTAMAREKIITTEELIERLSDMEWKYNNGIYKKRPDDFRFDSKLKYRKYVINFRRKKKK